MSQLSSTNSSMSLMQGQYFMSAVKKKNPGEMNVDEMIGSRVRTLRKAMGLTQVDLGEMIGSTGVYVSDLERGERRWQAERISKVAEVLKVSPSLLQDPAIPIDKIEKIAVILSLVSDLPEDKLDTIVQVLDGFHS